MTFNEKKWRQQRLQALATALGGNAPLGRKLGYKDGAYVGQMISGRRPITEKTIAKAEAIRDDALPEGAHGWFSREVAPLELGVSEPPAPYDVIAPEYRQLLADLEVLAPSRRSALLDQIHQAAEEAREILEHHRPGKVAAARRPTTTRRTATAMTQGDGNRWQASLPLVPARDPFTAAPSDREAKFYARVEQAPKAQGERYAAPCRP